MTAKADSGPVLLRADADGVATLTLNRPARFNALSEDLLDALQHELDAISRNESIRVVTIAGAGKAFCAGHDLKEMLGDIAKPAMQALFAKCSRMMLTLIRLPQPTIARVQGLATAAGCQLVAQCDLAVASEDARFATSGINVGLFCSTPAVPVTRNLPRKQAMEMLLTGDFMDAATALQRGFVNRVVPAADLDGAVADLAARIVAKPPLSVAYGKRMFYRQAELGLEEAYRFAAEVMACNIDTEDAREGIKAFVEKRPMPAWKGR
ncbi:MAG: enoyl-CoA hydratase [Magnetospirillum sp. WYHS-4]